MDELSWKRIAKVGTVTAVATMNGKIKARVLFGDTKMTSDFLTVLQRPKETSAGVTEEAGDPVHTHKVTVNVTQWKPEIGATVLVVYLPVRDSDGFIVGQI